MAFTPWDFTQNLQKGQSFNPTDIEFNKQVVDPFLDMVYNQMVGDPNLPSLKNLAKNLASDNIVRGIVAKDPYGFFENLYNAKGFTYGTPTTTTPTTTTPPVVQSGPTAVIPKTEWEKAGYTSKAAWEAATAPNPLLQTSTTPTQQTTPSSNSFAINGVNYTVDSSNRVLDSNGQILGSVGAEFIQNPDGSYGLNPEYEFGANGKPQIKVTQTQFDLNGAFQKGKTLDDTILGSAADEASVRGGSRVRATSGGQQLPTEYIILESGAVVDGATGKVVGRLGLEFQVDASGNLSVSQGYTPRPTDGVFIANLPAYNDVTLPDGQVIRVTGETQHIVGRDGNYYDVDKDGNVTKVAGNNQTTGNGSGDGQPELYYGQSQGAPDPSTDPKGYSDWVQAQISSGITSGINTRPGTGTPAGSGGGGKMDTEKSLIGWAGEMAGVLTGAGFEKPYLQEYTPAILADMLTRLALGNQTQATSTLGIYLSALLSNAFTGENATKTASNYSTAGYDVMSLLKDYLTQASGATSPTTNNLLSSILNTATKNADGTAKTGVTDPFSMFTNPTSALYTDEKGNAVTSENFLQNLSNNFKSVFSELGITMDDTTLNKAVSDLYTKYTAGSVDEKGKPITGDGALSNIFKNYENVLKGTPGYASTTTDTSTQNLYKSLIDNLTKLSGGTVTNADGTPATDPLKTLMDTITGSATSVASGSATGNVMYDNLVKQAYRKNFGVESPEELLSNKDSLLNKQLAYIDQIYALNNATQSPEHIEARNNLIRDITQSMSDIGTNTNLAMINAQTSMLPTLTNAYATLAGTNASNASAITNAALAALTQPISTGQAGGQLNLDILNQLLSAKTAETSAAASKAQTAQGTAALNNQTLSSLFSLLAGERQAGISNAQNAQAFNIDTILKQLQAAQSERDYTTQLQNQLYTQGVTGQEFDRENFLNEYKMYQDLLNQLAGGAERTQATYAQNLGTALTAEQYAPMMLLEIADSLMNRASSRSTTLGTVFNALMTAGSNIGAAAAGKPVSNVTSKT